MNVRMFANTSNTVRSWTVDPILLDFVKLSYYIDHNKNSLVKMFTEERCIRHETAHS